MYISTTDFRLCGSGPCLHDLETDIEFRIVIRRLLWTERHFYTHHSISEKAT